MEPWINPDFAYSISVSRCGVAGHGGWYWAVALEERSTGDFHELLFLADCDPLYLQPASVIRAGVSEILHQITGYTRDEWIAEFMQVVPAVRSEGYDFVSDDLAFDAARESSLR